MQAFSGKNKSMKRTNGVRATYDVYIMYICHQSGGSQVPWFTKLKYTCLPMCSQLKK